MRKRKSYGFGTWGMSKEARKYQLGCIPCANCQSYSHSKCRPRLDGTLCSCSCEHAETNRAIHEAEAKIAGKSIEDMPVRDSMAHFYPVISKRMLNC